MNFKDKVVVITGASSGIGEALVYEFGAQGARVVMGARREEKLAQIAEKLQKQGIQCAFSGYGCHPRSGLSGPDCAGGRTFRWGRYSDLQRRPLHACALFDDVDLQVLKRLMDVQLLGRRLLHQVCPALHPGLPRNHRRRQLRRRSARFTGPYRIFGPQNMPWKDFWKPSASKTSRKKSMS